MHCHHLETWHPAQHSTTHLQRTARSTAGIQPAEEHSSPDTHATEARMLSMPLQHICFHHTLGLPWVRACPVPKAPTIHIHSQLHKESKLMNGTRHSSSLIYTIMGPDHVAPYHQLSAGLTRTQQEAAAVQGLHSTQPWTSVRPKNSAQRSPLPQRASQSSVAVL